MIAGKRKTIGVFLCKAYSVFDHAVYHALEEAAHKLNYDVIIFTTVGFFSSQNEYDSQERGMFAFAPIEQLDGILVALESGVLSITDPIKPCSEDTGLSW